MKIKCLVVDDEPLAIEVLVNYIDRMNELELVGRCENALDAFALLQKESVDVLFLDIEMPLLDGLSFLKTLKNPPQVVITTAYRDYAVESFELDVLDYLIKPIPFPRFMKAIGKVLPKKENAPPPPLVPDNEVDSDDFMFFKVDKKMVKINICTIVYIESLKDYIRIKTKTEELVTYQTMQGVFEKLPPEKFIRIHKSFIVALQKVDSVEGNEVNVGGKMLPIGRMYREEALEKIYKTGIFGSK